MFAYPSPYKTTVVSEGIMRHHISSPRNSDGEGGKYMKLGINVTS